MPRELISPSFAMPFMLAMPYAPPSQHVIVIRVPSVLLSKLLYHVALALLPALSMLEDLL
jgi:hypothetical protein